MAVIYPHVRWELAPESLAHHLISAERLLLEGGDPSHHTVIIAAPKSGLRAFIASARYFLEPKLKRILREIRGLFPKSEEYYPWPEPKQERLRAGSKRSGTAS